LTRKPKTMQPMTTKSAILIALSAGLRCIGTPYFFA
jgi:hypothetical protein